MHQIISLLVNDNLSWLSWGFIPFSCIEHIDFDKENTLLLEF